ncbi:GTPase-activating protein [Dissophora globulifera]|nr:GTPase-activating protein [Dissophora globulifera]
MMTTRHTSSLSDDDEGGRDYDAVDDYGASSGDDEHPADHHRTHYDDDDDEDDLVAPVGVQTAHHHASQSSSRVASMQYGGVSSPATALPDRLSIASYHSRSQGRDSAAQQPTSPLSARSQHTHDSFGARQSFTSHGHTALSQSKTNSIISNHSLAHGTADNMIHSNHHTDSHLDSDHDNDHDGNDDKVHVSSRNSWEENSEEEEPYQAYDYGPEDEDEEEDDFNERPHSHLQQEPLHRHSVQSITHNNQDEDEDEDEDDHHKHSAPKQDQIEAEVNNFYDDYDVDEDDEDHRDISSAQPQHRAASFDSRRSSLDNDRGLGQGQHDQYLHNDNDNDSDDDRHAGGNTASVNELHDELDEPTPHPNPNPDMFRRDLDNRASLSSVKSSSSHLKHESFGYDDRPVQPIDLSHSESQVSSESELEPKKPHVFPAVVPSTPSPPMPSASRPTSTFSVASVGAPASPVAPVAPVSPVQSRSSVADRWKFAAEAPSQVASRPTSTLSQASVGAPVSPVQSRPSVADRWKFAAEAPSQFNKAPVVAAPAPVSVPTPAPTPIPAPLPATLPAVPAPASPVAPVVAPAPEAIMERTGTPQSPLVVDTVSTSSASSIDQRQHRRFSGSESDTSDTSIDLLSPTVKSNLRTGAPIFGRSLSNTSKNSRETASSQTGAEKQRPISYATVFSDAELNDVNLMDEPPLNDNKRASEIIPLTPSTPSTGFGFPSNFFGGNRASQQQQPSAQQQQRASTQQGAQRTAGQSPVPAASPPTPIPTSALPTPPVNETRARSTSISALASSIQGAFSRGFSSQSQPPVPPMPKTPTQVASQRASTTTTPVLGSGGPRFSLNRSNGSDRASTISNMTNDSNMDLLLARLEAQNELLVNDSNKRRVTSESEVERAIGQAKEENAGDDIDWDYWGALTHDYEGVAKRNPKQLTAMIQKGVPSALRGLIWQLLAKSKDPVLESTYAELLKSTSSHEKQITRDMSRTFPNHEYFQADGVGQEALFNVVKAYSLYDPEVGYCQGLSFVVGPLLLNMPEEEAFSMLVRMMNNYEMRGHYTPDMSMLQQRLFQFEQLMEETVPLVFKHLRNQGIRSTMYASQWFMTLFAYKFPLELVYRVYDIILVEGVDSMLRFAIALLKANHDRILSLDFEVLIEFLKSGLFGYYTNEPGLFIQDAYNVKVTPKKLAQYAQKYQAMIQKQQAEIAAEESLKESNRQLSSQVRGLESSLNQLNMEHVDLAKELIMRKMEMAQLQDQNDVLMQKVSDLTRIVDSQAKEVEDKLRGEIEDVLRKNMEYLKKNEQLEDQLSYVESLVVETKMKYAESEIERDALSRKLSDMRKALGVA